MDTPIISVDDVAIGDYETVLDVRPHAPTSLRIDGSVVVSYEDLIAAPEHTLADRSSPVLVVCDIGMRSKMAVDRLVALGYTNAVSLDGGLDAWRRAGRPLTGSGGLTPDQLDRYDRHLKLGGVGAPGQRLLLDATVVVVGAGGLGAPVLSYLAAAGVGTLRIVDDDVVDASNLQRQPIHTLDDVGVSKTRSAAASIARLNPDVAIQQVDQRLTDDTADGILTGADVIVDATDNFDARYAINDAAVRLGIPVVYASVYRMEGQVAVFDASRGPCYRCVYPDGPGHDMPLDCLTIGVLGSVTGTLGSLQATETIKLIVGAGEPLIGRLLLYDASDQSFMTLPVAKDPNCRACGPAGLSRGSD